MTAPDSSELIIRVLGPVEVDSGNGLAPLGGPKQRALLGMLTAQAGQVVTTDELVEGIWGDDPPAAVSSSIHSYISTLRTVIDQPIERHGSGYVLGVDHLRIDAGLFENDVDSARRDQVVNPTATAEGLRRALALWRGRAYADVADFPGLRDEARRLTDLRLDAVEIRINADLALGRHGAVVGELEGLAAEYPFRESLRAKHMLALYRDGRQADALRAYQRTLDSLREELGVDPSPELAELEQRILNHDYTLIHSREVVNDHVALLFTEIVDSTLLWEADPNTTHSAFARHNELVESAIEVAGGTVIKGLGYGFIAAFSEPALAARAAINAQRAILSGDWAPLELKVRMAIDTGEVERRGGELFGPPMNRGSRLLGAAHGGQIVLSDDAQKAITRDAGTKVKSLGEHRLRGIGTPQALHQLLADELESSFPPLNASGPAIQFERTFGDSIRGYELREQIGRGAFGTVYRGYQPSIGREVAIKIVRPEFANHPQFIRRFESEARLVASLEHPHIVSVYDYWRDADGAYVVGPYLAGRSLADGTGATLSLPQVVKLAVQVGAALSYAHRQGVLHLDVKPANILMDTDGNAYLADFGIAARTVEAATGVQSKSIGYRAPEDLEGGPMDARSDLYGLTAVVATLLTGTPPERLDPNDLHEPIRGVLDRGLALDPENRFDSVDEFVAHLAKASGATTEMRPPPAHRNPYKGLAAFTEDDAGDFFGRSSEIDRMVTMVESNRLSAVVGPSGSGKSSLVIAGLLPALASGAVKGSETWISVRTAPGAYPFDELALALSAVTTQPLSVLVTELAAADGKGLLRVAKRIGDELDCGLVMVIDQFEELFTLVSDETVRDRFISSIVAASDQLSKVRIVLTLRADFLHQLLVQPVLGPIIARVHLALAPLDAGGLRLAIVAPAAQAGLEFEPGLPERIVADLKGQPGSLPLLQYTLDRLALAATDGFIADDRYQQVGGVKGALADRAETTFQALTSNQKRAAQQVFTRLLSVSDEADDVRRRVRMTELESLGLLPTDLRAITAAFGKERLLTFDIDPVTRGATIEVAHEALLREWLTLRDWVDSRRGSLIVQRQFQVALREWEDSGRNPSNLLSGGKLHQYEDWATGQEVTLATKEREFLEASVGQRTREEHDRRTRRRMIMAGFVVAAVLALTLATVSVVQRDRAEENAALAQGRELILEAEKNIEFDPELGTLLALEAIDSYQGSGREPPGDAVTVLRKGIESSAVQQRFPGGGFVAVNHDGSLLATGGEDGEVVVSRAATGEILATLDREGGFPIQAAFGIGDVLEVAYADVNPPVRVWKDWRDSGSFVDIGPDRSLTTSIGEYVQVSPDGELVAIEGSEVWSMSGVEMLYSLPNDDPRVVAFSPDGRLAFFEYSSEGSVEVRILAADSGDDLGAVGLDIDFEPEWLAFSPEGMRLAIAGESELGVIDLVSGATAWQTGALYRVGPPLWLSGGTRLLVGGESQPAVVDATTGAVMRLLPGHRGGTFSYAELPHTGTVVSAGKDDRDTIIFDLEAAPFEVGSFTSSISKIDHMGFADGGANLWVLVNGAPQSGAVIDAVTGGTKERFPGSEMIGSSSRMYSAGFDAERRSVAWSTPDGREVFVAPSGWEIPGVSDDGTLAVITGPSTRVVTTDDGSLVAELDAGPGLWGAIFSPDRRFVVTNNNGSEYPGIRVFEVSTGNPLGNIGTLAGISDTLTPDGTKLVVPGYDGHINIFDFAKLRSGVDEKQAIVRRIPAHAGIVISAVVSPDGSKVFSRAWDEPVKVWDMGTGESLGEFGIQDPATKYPPAAAFHPTEPWLYATVGDSQIAIYTLDTDELVEMARSRLTRGLTEEECQLYLLQSCPAPDG